MTKDEIKLALDAVLIGFKAERFMTDADYTLQDRAVLVLQEALNASLAEQPAPVAKPHEQEPVALKWQQTPIRTAWGDDMVVASVAIDNDHTLSLYCERDQAPKVDAMFAQRTWVGLTDEEIIVMSRYDLEYAALIGEVQRKLKEKNT